MRNAISSARFQSTIPAGRSCLEKSRIRLPAHIAAAAPTTAPAATFVVPADCPLLLPDRLFALSMIHPRSHSARIETSIPAIAPDAQVKRTVPAPSGGVRQYPGDTSCAVSYTHLRAHETVLDLVCR